MNVNTFERFKAFDRVSMLKEAGDKVWRAIASGAALRDPERAQRVFGFGVRGSKSWQFSYWFCFPALKLGTGAGGVTRRSPNRDLVDARLASSLDARRSDAGVRGDGGVGDAGVVREGSGSIRDVRHAPLTEMNAMLKASRMQTDGSDVSRVFFVLRGRGRTGHPGGRCATSRRLAAARFDLGDERRRSVISVRTRAGRVAREHSRVFELVFLTRRTHVFGKRRKRRKRTARESRGHPLNLRESTLNPFPVVGWELNPRGRTNARAAWTSARAWNQT